jgi:hypothetical protein
MTEPARSYIAPLRVRCAFGDESSLVEPMIVIDSNGGRATLRTLRGDERVAQLADESAFNAALDRPDLTRLQEHPFLLVNAGRGLVALAFGPQNVPTELSMRANIVRLEDGSAVEIPCGDDAQPSWLLFEAEIGLPAAPHPEITARAVRPPGRR